MQNNGLGVFFLLHGNKYVHIRRQLRGSSRGARFEIRLERLIRMALYTFVGLLAKR
ncbi:hypothetical protein HAX54_009148, partial [Datura stramonium]|nr:hypothetical protein [Datura stramonium]